jgi:hypothetical protein
MAKKRLKRQDERICQPMAVNEIVKYNRDKNAAHDESRRDISRLAAIRGTIEGTASV